MPIARRAAAVGAWAVVGVLLAVAAARVLAWDARSLLVGLNALTPVLYLPAWPVAVGAAAAGRGALAAAATVAVVAHAAFALPELLAAEPVPAWAAAAPRMRVFDANVMVDNRSVAGYAAEIGRSRPDLVVLEEARTEFLARLDATGVLTGLPFRITIPRSDPFAGVVVSRWPLHDDDLVRHQGRPFLTRATVDGPAGPFRLFVVHAVSPVGGDREKWTGDLAAVGAALRAETLPVVAAGDFNATWGNRGFRRLLTRDVTDAAAARRRPWQMTWPRDRRLLPPLARIDHILTTPGAAVVRIRTGDGEGSDHRPLVADVALRP